ncbi:hypothetical protein G9A89_019123 [Geosiphon pyriformis]|nr:hypothetical protein G9A89_019123 [Geosiphon pyriformis]
MENDTRGQKVMESDESTYKAEKELWVTGLSGGSMWEINSVTGVLLTSYILWSTLTINPPSIITKLPSFTNFFFEYFVIIVPSLLACTVLSSYSFFLNLFLLTLSGYVTYKSKPKQEVETKKKQSYWEKKRNEKKEDNDNISDDSDSNELHELVSNKNTYVKVVGDDYEDGLMAEGKDAEMSKKVAVAIAQKPFLSAYRAGMIILTCLSILAVDFPVFPRRFAKVEVFGTSLMDLGVGSFVFSSGIVAAKPFLKKPENRFKPLGGQLFRAIRQSLPILTIGFVRFLMVKGVDYQQHVTEYGLHWNFFFTLGFLPIFVTICRTVQKYVRFSLMGLGIALVYQQLLSRFGLEDFIHHAPRSNIISANKEGLCSFLGYLAIFLLALDTGHYILPPDPYYAFRENRKSKNPKQKKLAMILFSWSSLWWLAFLSTYGLRIEVSRKMANLPYVLWVAAFNTTSLLFFQLIELLLFPNYWKTSKKALPDIMEAMNFNGLGVFLVANLLTGLINLSIRTLYTDDFTAELVLASYLFLILVIGIWWWKKGWRFRL